MWSTSCLSYIHFVEIILLFSFGKLSSRDFIMVIPLTLCFTGLLTVSYLFPWCFCMFPPVFLRFPPVFLLFPCSISPVSYFRICDILLAEQLYISACKYKSKITVERAKSKKFLKVWKYYFNQILISFLLCRVV